MASLYIHIPFCKSKCFYCSFASRAKKDRLIVPYIEALKREAVSYPGIFIDTVYIGGGTPTYLAAEQLQEILLVVWRHYTLKKDAEVTIEANPATFDLKKAQALRGAGVNRVSLGIQSLNDKYLKFLGRPHSSKEALSAFDILRRAGFSNISVDLIYSLSGQTKQEIKKDVSGILALKSEHISLYSLSVARGSEFYRRKVTLPLPEAQAGHFLYVKSLLEENGFCHYEVSNFARKGFECRHNMNYWKGGDYIGLGAAAHSCLEGRRFWNYEEIEKYISLLCSKGSAKKGEEHLKGRKRLMEILLIGLRMVKGVHVQELESRLKTKLSQESTAKIAELVKYGVLEKKSGRLRATALGIVLLDEICAHLI